MSLTKYGHDHNLAITLSMIPGCFVYSLEEMASWLSSILNHKQFGWNSHLTQSLSLLSSLWDTCKFGWSPRTALPTGHGHLQDYPPPSLMSLTFQPMPGLIHWPPTIVEPLMMVVRTEACNVQLELMFRPSGNLPLLVEMLLFHLFPDFT